MGNKETMFSNYLKVLPAALACGYASVAFSQPLSLEALNERLERLESHTATYDDVNGIQQSLESYKWEQQRQYELRTVQTSRPLQVYGAVQTRLYWSDTDTTSGSVYKRDSSSDVSFTLLGISGNLYRDYEEGRNLNFRLSYGASPQAGAPNLSVLDAILTYELLPTLDREKGRLNISLGQRVLPFGLEVSASEELKPVIRGAQFSTGLGLTQRQTGVYLSGDAFPFVDHGFAYRAPLLAWDIGIINGTGTNKTDDNGKKDLVGRLQFIAPVDNYTSLWRELKIGVSGYKGSNNLSGTNGVYGYGDFSRYGLDFSYNHNPIDLTIEYVKGKDERVTDSVNNTSQEFDTESTVVTLFFNKGQQFVRSFRGQAKYDDWWPKTYQPFIRWDNYKSESYNSNTQQKEQSTRTVSTLGFNYFFAQSSKVQLNLNHVNDDSKPANKRTSNEVLAQIQFGF